MKPTEKLYEALRNFEGLRLKAYKCPSGVWTIGYGHTSGVTPGMEVNQAWAERMLRQDVAAVMKQIEALKIVFEHPGQVDAVADFVFNLGITNFKRSGLLRKIREKSVPAAICAEFEKWVYATQNGKKVQLDGLKRRRAWECGRWCGL